MNAKKRNLYLKIKIACILAALFTSQLAAGQKATKPNIIIILADDLGYHDLSYYNTPDIRTANLDALCKGGIRFDNFYANSPVCSPSRASLLSGRYPEMVGVPGLIRNKPEDSFGYLTPNTVLLPELLKKVGYKTAIVGKWNLGLEAPNLPNQKGFDHFHGWLDDMMEDYWKHLRNGKNYLRENSKEITAEGHATDLFTQWSVDYINKVKAGDKPFFLYLAYTAPHAPIQPSPEFLVKVRKRQPEISEKRAKLVALIEQMDDGVGQIVRSLKAKGLYDNTIIVFVSDNGGALQDDANNGDLRDGKGSMYEGGLRIPAFISWPKQVKAGSTSAERLALMDIYPTLAEITKAKTNHKIDGVSFLSILENGKSKLAPRSLFFIRREGFGYVGKTSNAVINDNMKLLQTNPFQPLELYDLSADPLEKHNLINSNTGKRRSLVELMMKQIQSGGSIPWQKSGSGK